MPTDSRLWRLIADCERLVKDESVALGGQDFEALERVQGITLPLFEELHQLMVAVGDRGGDELARGRIAALIAAEEKNLAQVKSMLGEARAEKQSLITAALRLRELSDVYGDPSADRTGFCAHG